MARNITSEEFFIFSEQLRQLLSSDFPLADGLHNFSREIKSPSFKNAIEGVAKRLSGGESLSRALEAEGDPFSPEYIGLIRAGEESDNLIKMLDTALEHENYISQLENKLRLAIYYPIFVFIWSFLIFSAALAHAYPMFERFYATTETAMPMTLRVIHMVFCGPSGLYLVFWTGLIAVLIWLVKRRNNLTSLAFKFPGLRKLVADVYSARLSRSLGLMLESGISMDNALLAVAASTSDRVIRERLIKASHRVSEGEMLSSALIDIGLSGTRFSDLVLIGEESGVLPGILTKGADLFRIESETRLEKVVRLTGAILTIAVGIWVLFLLLSWYSTYFLIPMAAL